ncbi:MAG: hypothetical protein ACPGU7_08455 [Gammaproteobacteria bacterium]
MTRSLTALSLTTLSLAALAAAMFAAPALAQQGGMPNAQAMFIDKMDTDKDGKVSLDEFRAPGDKMFAAMDSNGDGMIDTAEAKAFHQQMMQRMQQMRQQFGGQQGR